MFLVSPLFFLERTQMLTHQVTVTGFDKKEYTKELHFHISVDDLMDFTYLQGELEELAGELEKVEGGAVASDELRQRMTDMIKKFIKISYGELDPNDATRFLQDDPVGEGEIFKNFKSSKYYGAFLMELLRDANTATAFMTQVMPEELMAQVDDSVVASLVGEQAILRPVNDVELPQPPRKKSLNEYTRKELVELPAAEFDELVGTDARNWSAELMGVAMQRKQQGGSPSSEG